MEGYTETLRNGLRVAIDYLSFTLDNSHSVSAALELLGYDYADFTDVSHGAMGYKRMLRLNGFSVSILYDGNEGMGVHVTITGSAISEVIRSFKESFYTDEPTPFGTGCYNYDIDSSILVQLLKAITSLGHITRCDLAVDDVGADYFTIDDIKGFYASDRIVSKFRSFQVYEKFQGRQSAGKTLYFGSRKSDLFLRIYDKQAEQNQKFSAAGSPILDTPWTRWEFECKGAYADRIAHRIIDGCPLGDIAVGILNNYMRIIELDNNNRTRCTVNAKWQAFIDGVGKLSLYVQPGEKTIDSTKDWLNRQVMPGILTVLLADGNSEFFDKNLEAAKYRLTSKHFRMIQEAVQKVGVL